MLAESILGECLAELADLDLPVDRIEHGFQEI